MKAFVYTKNGSKTVTVISKVESVTVKQFDGDKWIWIYTEDGMPYSYNTKYYKTRIYQN